MASNYENFLKTMGGSAGDIFSAPDIPDISNSKSNIYDTSFLSGFNNGKPNNDLIKALTGKDPLSQSAQLGSNKTSESDFYAKLMKDNADAATKATNSLYGKLGSAAVDAGEGIAKLGGVKMADKDAMSGGVDVLSQGLISSGNPYFVAGGVALKGLDTLDRAGGTTVKGVKDNIGSASYTNLSTQDTQTRWSQDFFGNKGKNLQNQNNDAYKMIGKETIIKKKQDLLNDSLGSSSQNASLRNQKALQGGFNGNSLMGKQGLKLSIKNIKSRANRKYKALNANTGETIINSEDGGSGVDKFAQGGKMNVIPEGALHARKHNLPEEIASEVTNKGIPVITIDEEGEITQHAEIEHSEIIFHLEATQKLEELNERYKQGDENAAIEAGKLLTYEILENTEDNVGMLESEKEEKKEKDKKIGKVYEPPIHSQSKTPKNKFSITKNK